MGATYVDDEQAGAAYELRGVDSEIRLRDGTRLSAEYAESDGIDAHTYVSLDGGMTFEESSLDSTTRGPRGVSAPRSTWASGSPAPIACA